MLIGTAIMGLVAKVCPELLGEMTDGVTIALALFVLCDIELFKLLLKK